MDIKEAFEKAWRINQNTLANRAVEIIGIGGIPKLPAENPDSANACFTTASVMAVAFEAGRIFAEGSISLESEEPRKPQEPISIGGHCEAVKR